ncbi:uncharacterized protein [Anoplolepis gracilipes]|uniref:uncharacterized protein n=1 Tax=Anoplolepis gracilipes TaxID=354296 RepID=UPI003B9F755A
MDQISAAVPFNSKERACMAHFLKTTKRNEDGQFIVQMSFKEVKLQQLGESRSVALNRFLSMERANTLHEVKRIRDEITNLLEKGGFQLRKWASNSLETLQDMSCTESHELVHFINKGQEVCTLSMQWNITNNEFQYDINVTNARKSHRFTKPNFNTTIVSKSPVAPLKAVNLPRLELCGVLLLVQLMDKVLKALRCNPENVFYWTDSTIILHWIKATDKRWNVFVSNRIGEIHKLSQASRWHHVTTESNPADHELPEQKRVVNTMLVIQEQDKQNLYERFSSLNKLIRINALCLRYVHNIKNRAENRLTGRITTQELVKSTLRLVKSIQEAAFKENLQALKSKECVSRRSKLSNLSPFIDEQSILRVGGLLKNEAISPDAKHPILLPAHHPFTQLIIAHEHQDICMQEHKQHYAIRTKYWPLSTRSTSEAVMSELPSYRSQSTHRVGNLSTERFLNALNRFIARRGKVSYIYFDNGTNFQGAANKLKEFYQMLHTKHHQEGIWEAALKSAKGYLNRVIGDAALTFEELYIVLSQIEAVMNSRPLTPLSADPNDLSYLTPGHFLVGDALTSVPQQDVTHMLINRLSRWQHINHIYQHFWKRWNREYLQLLQQ